MQLTEIHYENVIPVDGYGPGFFRLAGQVLEGAVIVGPHGASQWQGLSDVQALVNLAGAVDVILLGTGAEIAHIPAALKDAVERAGMGVEPMISPSACRSYNVLASEGRRVALAALPV